MNRPCLLIIFAILLGAMLMVRPASASFSFDETTETTCSGNVCTKTLYSGYSPAFFDNIIRKSSNWLKFYNVVYLEKDSNFNLELTSFNDTNFIVHLNVPLSQSNKQIPLKLCDEKSCSNVSILMNVLRRDVTVGMNPLLLSNITFGFASTTIKLQTANSENLEDTSIRKNQYDTNFGADNGLYLFNQSTYNSHGMIKFNLSSIPVGATIENASASFWLNVNNLDGATEGFNVSANHLYNQTWVEEYPTYNNFGTLGEWNTTKESDFYFFGGAGEPLGWITWTVTNMVSKEYSDGNKNISIFLYSHDMFGSPGSVDNEWVWSKENANSSYRPYLNITYTEGADSTPPTYSNNMTNSTTNGTANQHDLKWTDNVALSGYIFSFDNCTSSLANDTWVSMSGATNWSNVTKIVNSTLGCTIRWCVYANDTSNNWNGTSCSTPFSYVTTAAPSIFSATFNIKTKELLNLPGRVILFGRFLNTRPKTNDTFSRMIVLTKSFNVPSKEQNTFLRNPIVQRMFNILSEPTNNFFKTIGLERIINLQSKEYVQVSRNIILERTLNANEKTSNIFSALLEQGLQTFERFLNIGTKAADSFFYMITGMRFLNVPTKDANQFNRNIIVTKFLNVSTKDKINFLRNTVVEKLFNVSQKESNQFSRAAIISRLLNIQEKMNVSWLSQLPYNIFERLLSIPLDLIDIFIVYVRVWEQPSIYQVCSILQQIGDSRAYLCIYDTGEWKILIRGV